MTNQIKIIGGIVLATLVVAALIFFMTPQDRPYHDESAAGEFERGPHRGRMLREGDFALEMAIFEDGVPPEFHVYPTDGGDPIPPKEVALSVTLTRLDGEANVFRFGPVDTYLRGNGVVHEPHSFDVAAAATYKGKSYAWTYASYEGRTKIPEQTAVAAGMKIESAGPGTIATTVGLSGRIVLAPDHSAQVRPRFAGTIREVRKNMGDQVQAGDVLAIIESNESLQPTQLRSPIAGKVTHRAANIGEVTGARALFEIANTGEVVAEFHVFPRHAGLVKEGQKVAVRALEAETSQEGTIAAVASVADPATQSIAAHVRLNNADGHWIPGTAVAGRVVTDERQVPLVVKNSGLQTFRDFTVVFAKVGDTYEVRMLELGESDGAATEVLGGLKPGTAYVTENSFLIKADVEKSGASHDH